MGGRVGERAGTAFRRQAHKKGPANGAFFVAGGRSKD